MQQNILMSDETLFRDCSIFDGEHTPEQFRFRDTQLSRIAENIRPAFHGARPLNMILRGPPGTGKTTSVKQVFGEIEGTTRKIIPVLVNCRRNQTEYRVFRRIYEAVFHQKPPVSGVCVQSLTETLCGELSARGAVLLICLDDANFIFHDNLLEKVLGTLLRLYEEYPGIRTGIIVTVSNIDIPVAGLLSPSVVSVFQPNEIYFPPYGEGEVRAILRDRVRAGLYPDVITPEILDSIVQETMRCSDLRMGIALANRSVLRAESAGRRSVSAADVVASVQEAENQHLKSIVRTLREDERNMLGAIGTLYQQTGEEMISGDLYRALQPQVPMCYTLFFERLEKFRNLGLIKTYRPPKRGNTRRIVLQYGSGRVRDVCSAR